MKKGILIYDDHCPLCVCYTNLFVKTGLLAPEERRAFSELPDDLLSRIDFVRGSNEIPLINEETGTVYYGIDALLEVLGRRMPWIKKAGNLPGLSFLLRKLYKLISYNRKVIVATACGKGEIDCSPSFNIRYRVLFLLLGLLFSILMLPPVHALWQRLPVFSFSQVDFQVFFFVLIAFCIALSAFLKKQQAFEFLGQVIMLAIICNLLLIPAIILGPLLNPIVLSVYLVGLAIIVFREFIRRMTYAARFLKNHG